MKIEETLKDIECGIRTGWGDCIGLESLKVAAEALKKQIPEQPYMESDGEADGFPVWDYYCPVCLHNFDEEESKHCPDCGQAIDWSVKNKVRSKEEAVEV